jgi:hypothetical protein
MIEVLQLRSTERFPMAYTKNESVKKAVELVTTALQSTSIKLFGSTTTNLEAVEKATTSDAAYLAKLLTDLSASLQKLGD